ncbi:MAG: amidohydrolase family protein [Spirochaetota bacterium]|nr:MAG: amidohydrolase family protein [Spirochaetota bacterium]
MNNEYSISEITIVTPKEALEKASIRIGDGKIKDFSKSTLKDYPIKGDYILFPALINAHDHLFGTYYPKIGNGPYICWLPWDYDLKSSEVYDERNKNTPYEVYLFGAYKNLISGVTTVHDHIPHVVNNTLIDKLPIRVLKEYTLAHEASVYDLKWGDGIEIEYKRAVEKDLPFVTHIEEGFDEESLRGVDTLEQLDALSDHTVVIHGIGFSEKDIKLLAKKKVNFIWCPGSNMFMFQRTAKVKEIIEAGVNVSIGTDSPASGELNLLEEVRFAKKVYKEMYGDELANDSIVRMITLNPAKAFRLDKRLGSLEKGKLGDLLIIAGDKKKPYKSLVEANLKDIALVIMEGKPLYGDVSFEEMFNNHKSEYTSVTIQGKDKLIIGDLNGVMEKMRKKVGFHKELPFLPVGN